MLRIHTATRRPSPFPLGAQPQGPPQERFIRDGALFVPHHAALGLLPTDTFRAGLNSLGYAVGPTPGKPIQLPGGTANQFPYGGVPKTIETMRRMVKDAITWELGAPTRTLVMDILAKVRPKDYLSEVAALYYWCLQNIRYQRDPLHVEYVQSPVVLLQKRPADAAAGRRAGGDDCESIATALAALIMSISVPCSFVTISMEPGGAFHHVFTIAKLPSRKVVVDPIPGPHTEAMLKGIARWQEWPIEPVFGAGNNWGVPQKALTEGTGPYPR